MSGKRLATSEIQGPNGNARQGIGEAERSRGALRALRHSGSGQAGEARDRKVFILEDEFERGFWHG